MKHVYSLFLFLVIAHFSNSQTVVLKVHQPEPLQIQAENTFFHTLPGGRLTLGTDLTFSGGTPPYQVNWSNEDWANDSVQNTITVAPTDTTVYTCTVFDSNGCQAQQYFQVNMVLPVQLQFNKGDVSCFGSHDGWINLTIEGGLKPYKISWDTGDSSKVLQNLGGGSYAVTVTDSLGQAENAVVTIEEPLLMQKVVNEIICEGASFLFFHSIPLSIPGVYSDTLKNINGCDSILILNLTVLPLPEEPIVIISGDTLTASGPASYQYQWSRNNQPITGKTGQTMIITESGNFSVEVFNESGCGKKSAMYEVIYSAVPVYQSPTFSLKVYPNPNNGLFTVEIESTEAEPAQVELLTISGDLVVTKQIQGYAGKNTFLFGQQNLAKGIYTLRVKTPTQTVSRNLIVK